MSVGKKDYMDLVTRLYEGEKDMPLVVFIHGMGMNANAWSDPSSARILGGKYPLKVLVGGSNAELRTSFLDMKDAGFSVLTWSQARPVGPVMTAVEELGVLMEEYSRLSRRGVIFICHSRGGLIARKYLESGKLPMRAVITLATPHHGTSMAKWAVSLSPVTTAVSRFLNGFSGKDVDSAFRRVLGFLASTGLRELLPGSRFFKELKDVPVKNAKYFSLGGTNPDMLRAISVSIPELVSRLVPGIILPPEMRKGCGDGLVSADSAVLPYAGDHRDFHVNHASILFDKEAREYILRSVEAI